MNFALALVVARPALSALKGPGDLARRAGLEVDVACLQHAAPNELDRVARAQVRDRVRLFAEGFEKGDGKLGRIEGLIGQCRYRVRDLNCAHVRFHSSVETPSGSGVPFAAPSCTGRNAGPTLERVVQQNSRTGGRTT